MIHYYELSFYENDDDRHEQFCIKTEIENITPVKALRILFGDNPSEKEKEMSANFAKICEINEGHANEIYATDLLRKRVEDEKGVYYTTDNQEEAVIRNLLGYFENAKKEINDIRFIVNRAINALKEIQEYHEIGSIKECEEMAELRSPKCPEIYKTSKEYLYLCPKCGIAIGKIEKDNKDVDINNKHDVHRYFWRDNYCRRCGQALLWE